MRQPSDSGAVTGEPEGPDPVFVDASGRRARLLRRAGYGAAGLAAGYLSVLALSLMGATPFAPEALLPPLPGESSPTAPLRQDAEGDARPPEDAGAGVGPGTPLIPLITGEDPAGSLLLPPGAGPGSVAGVPVQPPDAGGVEVTDGPAPPRSPTPRNRARPRSRRSRAPVSRPRLATAATPRRRSPAPTSRPGPVRTTRPNRPGRRSPRPRRRPRTPAPPCPTTRRPPGPP
ncbi:hypothetical protein O1157_05965 [Streptomyces albogriseolus]